MVLNAESRVTKELLNNYNKRRQNRKKQQKKNFVAKIRLFIIIFVLLYFVLPGSFNHMYNYYIASRIQNSEIKVPSNPSVLLNSAESKFADNYFLDSSILSNTNTENPPMNSFLMTEKMPKLTARLQNLAASMPSIHPGVFIWDYSTGQYVTINGEEEFPTASIIKLPVLLQLFRAVEQNELSLKDQIRLTDYFVTGGSGYLQYSPIGTTHSVDHLANIMIRESDNSATNMLLYAIGGMNSLNSTLRDWGFSKTHLGNWLPDLYGTNVATPKDLATMLYNIDNPEFLSINSRAKIVEIMSRVRNRFLIKAGLPDNVQFIHKTGDIGTMLGDAGTVILPDGRKYIIVVMVKRPWNSYQAKEFIIQASKITYNSYVSKDI